MGLKIIRARQPPDEYLAQMLEMLVPEGFAIAFPAAAQRVRDLPKEDRFLFAVEEARVLGYAHVRVARDIVRDEAAEVATLLVRKADRRRGVGRRIISAAEAWALESGRALLLLRAQVGQRDLHAFCVALGYQEEGTSLAFARDLRPARRSEAPTQRL